MIINIISPHASIYFGGTEIVTIEMAKFLALNQIDVRFFTRKSNSYTDRYKNLKSLNLQNLKLIEVAMPSSSRLPDSSWPTFYQISCEFGIAAQKYYQEYNDADLFSVHLSVDALFTPNITPSVLHLHGNPTITDPLMTAAVRKPKKFIAHSGSIKTWWNSKYDHINPQIFQNGIDTSYFQGVASDNRPIDILYVGRFMEHKGIDSILRATSSSYKTVIAGNGPYLNELRKIIAAQNLNQSVTIYDTPRTETIRELYKRAKVFACPSKGREGVLTTMLEAGASGCAIVTTFGSGMTDLIVNKKNGLVVEPNNIVNLQEAFNTLINTPQQRILLANNLQRTIDSKWSWKDKIAKLIKIYESTI